MKTAREPRSKLYSIVEENLPQLTVTSVDRRLWAESAGHEYVEQLAFREDLESIKISLEGNYFATCCLAAVCLLYSNVSDWSDSLLFVLTCSDMSIQGTHLY